MRQIGRMFQLELERSIHRQVDLEGKPFWPVAWSTAKARQGSSNRIQKVARAKGVRGRIPGTVKVQSISGMLNQKRLLFTKRFVNGAFRAAPHKDYVKVMAWPGTYPGEDVSYRDIVRYNNKGSSSLNRHISNPPKIFPIGNEEVQRMQAFTKATALLSSKSTLKKILGREIRKKITVQF